MNIESRIEITDYLNDMLVYRHVGDVGMPRTIPTEWYRGNMTSPSLGTGKIDKLRMKGIATGIKAQLPLSSAFTGAVDFHINQGRFVKADVKPRA